MTRRAFLVGAAFVCLWSVPVSLYGFGSATHAYIVREVGDKEGPASLPEIYGAVLPDTFNALFGDPYQDHLATLTHYEFMKLVEQAGSETDKAVAYGFASHNEAWGADKAAHIISPDDPNAGYVTRKSAELAAALRPQVRLFLLFNRVPNSEAVLNEMLPTVAHTAIETAVDLLVCRNEDPDMGPRLLAAAQTRGWSAPLLLSKAYAADLAATAGTTEAVAGPLILAAESEFRYQMEAYGTALSQDDPAAALAEQGAELATLLLAARQGMVVDIPVDLMRQILDTAVEAVQEDYAAELAATIAQVRQELASHAIAKASL
jgi:hypothetical protein